MFITKKNKKHTRLMFGSYKIPGGTFTISDTLCRAVVFNVFIQLQLLLSSEASYTFERER